MNLKYLMDPFGIDWVLDKSPGGFAKSGLHAGYRFACVSVGDRPEHAGLLQKSLVCCPHVLTRHLDNEFVVYGVYL